MRFPLYVPLTGGLIDRAGELRADPAAVETLRRHPQARALAIWNGKAPIDLAAAPRIAWLPMSDAVAALGREAPILLGRLTEGAEAGPHFAIDISAHDDPLELDLFPEATKFIDLRSIAAELPVSDPPIWAEAKSLIDWHANHPHCSKCGAPSVLAQAGWRRDCPACGATHFPRTDPVVIMLVVRRATTGAADHDRVLIGRQPNWPPGMHSLLAGYIEPGETVEEAVRRETLEEAGVRCGAVGYLASQPWPFPSTLMLGCWAEALTDVIAPLEDELESVRWATKVEMRQALAGQHPEIAAPRLDAIARVLVEAWTTDQIALPF